MSVRRHVSAPASVSVLLPTFEQAAFIGRAMDSLFAQSLGDWEAIVIDDGSRDGTVTALEPWLKDERVRLLRFERNGGLGRALNAGLDLARAPLIAYLPSDDLFYREHLASLVALLDQTPGAVLAHSGLRHAYNRYAEGAIPGSCLQLVQCMHRRVDLRWTERAELESDDLDRLFWTGLRALGAVVGSGQVSCEWVDHPAQRHKLMREPLGGINPFRQHYRVRTPLRFHSSRGNAIDEVAQYAHLRGAAKPPPAPDGLRIVLAGELAYNADRVLALEALGHRLHGLWMPGPDWYNTVGPLPFGHVDDMPNDDWQGALARLEPDLIYAQLNWQAVPFAHRVMRAAGDIPFVWHFKEGPFICLEKGSWPQLADLFREADGCICSSPEMLDWFRSAVPQADPARPTCVLDGDLPRRDWFSEARTPLLSAHDGAIHTVVPGRPIGLHPPTVAALARRDIHLHFYGDFSHGQWREWIARTQVLAPGHLHLHPNVGPEGWVQEFSRYDAGWLHVFESRNRGEIRRADWDDLNYPARIATLAAAGLPMIQRHNRGAIVATQALTQRLGIGLFFDTIDDLAAQLRDGRRMAALRERVWAARMTFCFDSHAPALVGFFRDVIAGWRGALASAPPAQATLARTEAVAAACLMSGPGKAQGAA
jgi:glycosyltransferase involved in cell wall biosynthesis